MDRYSAAADNDDGGDGCFGGTEKFGKRVHDMSFADQSGFVARKKMVMSFGEDQFIISADEADEKVIADSNGGEWNAGMFKVFRDDNGSHLDGAERKIFDRQVVRRDDMFEELVSDGKFGSEQMVDEEQPGEL